MVSESGRDQSEFNMAVSYLNRLNSLFYVCDEAAMRLDVYSWFHSLMALYRELSTEMKNEEKEKFKKFIDDINPMITSALRNVKGRKEVKSELYNKLHEFELEIRTVLKDSGLQMKMAEDAAQALR